ncbi:MAG: hypothetical protein IJX01_02145 [Oscillospiraceae bacterium]|nr:hypothetical protein [Oscillospiraceae bacterium]
MNRRIRKFCASNDLDHRWSLLCEIEHLLKRSEKVSNFAAVVGCLCLLPFLVVTFLKIMWSIGFMTDNDISPIQQFMTQYGFISWPSVLRGLLAACICTPILVVIIYKIGICFGKKAIPEKLCGGDAYKAQKIAHKAKVLSGSSDDHMFMATTLLIIGGIIATAVIHVIDQTIHSSAPIWGVLLIILFSLIPLALPVGFAGFIFSFCATLPLSMLLDGIKLRRLADNADSEWVKLDPAEAARRKKQKENEEKAAQAAQRAYEENLRSSHTPIPSYSSYSSEKGLNTYMTDRRTGQSIYYKDGLYLNEDGDRVPLQYIEE